MDMDTDTRIWLHHEISEDGHSRWYGAVGVVLDDNHPPELFLAGPQCDRYGHTFELSRALTGTTDERGHCGVFSDWFGVAHDDEYQMYKYGTYRLVYRDPNWTWQASTTHPVWEMVRNPDDVDFTEADTVSERVDKLRRRIAFVRAWVARCRALARSEDVCCTL